MTEIFCPIWDTASKLVKEYDDGKEVISPRAGGRYFVAGSAESGLKNLNDDQKVQITTNLVEQRRRGTPCPIISTHTIIDVKENNRPMPIPERVDALLRFLGAEGKPLGTVAYIRKNDDDSDMPKELLAWTGSQWNPEVITLAEHCDEQGWMKLSINTNNYHEFKLKPAGYAYLEGIERPNSESSKAFIAMWFDPSVQDAYDISIEPAIRDAGYDPIRIDKKLHNNKIDDEIIAETRRSRFIVADFTHGEDGARGGVYFEAGFAKGLNIPVIFTCRKDMFDQVHFDTQQYNHIVWDQLDKFRAYLSDHISATIGDGPNKSSE